MPMTLRTSLIADQQVIDTTDGQIIRLPCLVSGMVPTQVGDTNVLSKCLSILPGMFAPHPDTVNCPNATLRERHVISRPSVTEALIMLVYRAPGITDWSLEEISQTEYLQTYTTALGSRNLDVWFSTAPDANTVAAANLYLFPPHGVKSLSIGVQKFFGKTVLKASGWMRYSDWQSVRRDVRAARWTINNTQWGDDVDADARGCWLFTQLVTRTRDLNITKEIELYFLNDPRGHFPIGVWYDINGFHQAGGISEKDLRALGPPSEDGVRLANGLSMFSVYRERNFNTLFTFDPSMS